MPTTKTPASLECDRDARSHRHRYHRRRRSRLFFTAPLPVDGWCQSRESQVSSDAQKKLFKGARLVIVVYDVSNRSSFESVTRYTSEARRHADNDAVFVLAGTKIDKHRLRPFYPAKLIRETLHEAVPHYICNNMVGLIADFTTGGPEADVVGVYEGLNLAKKLNFDLFCEVSAKTGQNIDILYRAAAQLVVEKRKHVRLDKMCPCMEMGRTCFCHLGTYDEGSHESRQCTFAPQRDTPHHNPMPGFYPQPVLTAVPHRSSGDELEVYRDHDHDPPGFFRVSVSPFANSAHAMRAYWMASGILFDFDPHRRV